MKDTIKLPKLKHVERFWPKGFEPANAVDIRSIKIKDLAKYIAMPKMDGVRIIFYKGKAFSKQLKPIPNLAIQAMATKYPQDIIVETEFVSDNRQLATSYAMSMDLDLDGKNWAFYFLDCFIPTMPMLGFAHRYGTTHYKVPALRLPFGSIGRIQEPLAPVDWPTDGLVYKEGYSAYYFGRANQSNPFFIKDKPYQEVDAHIIGLTQLYSNTNEAETNELGRSSRSSAKDGKQAMPMLGSLQVSSKHGNFSVGSGFTQATRKELWEQGLNNLRGHSVSIKFESLSPAGIPLQPVFLGFSS